MKIKDAQSIKLIASTLEDVCVLITDGSNHRRKYVEEGLPMVSVQDLTPYGINIKSCRKISAKDFENHVRKSCQPEINDVLIARAGPRALDKVCIMDELLNVVLDSSVAILRPNKSKIIPKFLQYYLCADSTKIYMKRVLITGAAMPRIILKNLQKVQISLPPLLIQQKIAAILSAYDNLIENNNRRIAILEETAQMIYREWFVKFRFPGHEKVKIVDSPLGKIPEGWECKAVSDVASVFKGRFYNSTELCTTGGLPFLMLSSISRDGGFRADGIKRYNGPFKDTHVAFGGDIIMAVTDIDIAQERRFVVRVGLVPKSKEKKFIYSKDLVKIVPNSSINKKYFYYFLRFSNFPDEIKEYATGVNVLHLKADHIKSYKFPIPPQKMRDDFSEHCEKLVNQVQVLENKNIVFRQTRDLLLPKLISGELDVSDLDIEVPEIDEPELQEPAGGIK